jgi:hypothetical protein
MLVEYWIGMEKIIGAWQTQILSSERVNGMFELRASSGCCQLS